MKILKKVLKVTAITMAALAIIWCVLYVYVNYFYNGKQIKDRKSTRLNSSHPD